MTLNCIDDPSCGIQPRVHSAATLHVVSSELDVEQFDLCVDAKMFECVSSAPLTLWSTSATLRQDTSLMNQVHEEHLQQKRTGLDFLLLHCRFLLKSFLDKACRPCGGEMEVICEAA